MVIFWAIRFQALFGGLAGFLTGVVFLEVGDLVFSLGMTFFGGVAGLDFCLGGAMVVERLATGVVVFVFEIVRWSRGATRGVEVAARLWFFICARFELFSWDSGVGEKGGEMSRMGGRNRGDLNWGRGFSGLTERGWLFFRGEAFKIGPKGNSQGSQSSTLSKELHALIEWPIRPQP